MLTEVKAEAELVNKLIEGGTAPKEPKEGRSRRFRYFQLALILLLAAGLIVLTLVLLGPQTGSVVSAVSKGLGGTNSAVGSTSSGTASKQAQPWDRKIIRNATLSLTVNEMEQALAQFRALALTEGGLVIQENTTQQDDRPSGLIVLQIPSQSFEDAITKIRQVAVKVTRQETTSQDVTEEYVDLKSQITNLQLTEQGFQKLIDKATKAEDLLALQRELGNVRGEIETRQGRLNFLDKRTAFSNITLNLSLPPVAEKPVNTEAEGWQPNKVVKEAWDASVKLLTTVATVILRVLVFSWWLLPLLLLGLGWWLKQRKPSISQL
ncbi:MAG: DUF4349 domain-containing protein [Chloroflexota bacterium]